MTGFERLKEQMEGQKDLALNQTVNYLLTRDDMEEKYLNEEKTISEMCEFIKEKARINMKNGWNFVTDRVVYAWAIMYFSLPNELLKIKTSKKAKTKNSSTSEIKNNVVSMEDAKKVIEKKKEIKQLSLFGGVDE